MYKTPHSAQTELVNTRFLEEGNSVLEGGKLALCNWWVETSFIIQFTKFLNDHLGHVSHTGMTNSLFPLGREGGGPLEEELWIGGLLKVSLPITGWTFMRRQSPQ